MLIIAGGILLAVFVLYFLPEIFQLILWLLVVAIILLIVFAFAYGIIPPEILTFVVIAAIVIWLLNVLDSIKWSKSSFTRATKAKYLMVNGNYVVNSPSIKTLIPISKKIKFKKWVKSLSPALTQNAKLRKLTAINRLDKMQQQYGETSITNAIVSLEIFTSELQRKILSNFKTYLDSGLLTVKLSEQKEADDKIRFGTGISIYFEDDTSTKIAFIQAKVYPISCNRVRRKISLLFPETDKLFYSNISEKKVHKRINRLVLEKLKANPSLVERISMETNK